MSKNRYDRKSQRRKEAEIRNSAWANLTPQQQLDQLNKLNLVAAKQRNKIQTKLNNK